MSSKTDVETCLTATGLFVAQWLLSGAKASLLTNVRRFNVKVLRDY